VDRGIEKTALRFTNLESRFADYGSRATRRSRGTSRRSGKHALLRLAEQTRRASCGDGHERVRDESEHAIDTRTGPGRSSLFALFNELDRYRVGSNLPPLAWM